MAGKTSWQKLISYRSNEGTGGEEGLGGDGGGGGLTWQQNTQIIKLSFQAYRHGKSHTHAEPSLAYLQLHTTPLCRLCFGSLSKKNEYGRSHRLCLMNKVEICGDHGPCSGQSYTSVWSSDVISVKVRYTIYVDCLEDWHWKSWPDTWLCR